MATLYIFAGLPGSGKTTLSQHLSRQLPAMHVRIDTIEQGLRDLCGVDVNAEGYRLAYRLAADGLRLGHDVIADSCNPIALSRREWREVAVSTGADFVDIEVVCSDPAEHRQRVEQRRPTVPGLVLPTWQQVVDRAYHAWERPRLVVDTAGQTVEQSVRALREALRARTERSMDGPGFEDTTPILTVTDLPRSLRYYAERLGFSIAWAWSDPEQRFDGEHPTFACVRRGECSLFLGENSHGEPGSWVFVNVAHLADHADVAAEYAASGAEVVQPAADMPWGSREMVVRDPDGNCLRIACPLGEGS